MSILLAILGFGKSFFGSMFSWLSKRSLAEIGCIILGLVALVAILNGRAEKRHSVKVEAQLVKCSNARHADQLAYRKAQAEAQAKNLADVTRAEQKQKDISHETVANLNDRLERLRRELRNPASQGSAGKPGLPQGGGPAPGTPGQARLCLAPEELLRGAESEERHDRLIDWVIRQSKVDPNRPD